MIGYATLFDGSMKGFFTDSLYKLTQWFSGIPTYWIVGGVLLFFLILRFFAKKV